MGMYTIALSKLLSEKDSSSIVAHHLHDNATSYGTTFTPQLDVSDRILTYQMGSSDATMSDFFIQTKAKKKILFYHNITPGEYFRAYQRSLVMEQWMAREELAEVALHADICVAMSDYSAAELQELGAKKVHTIPLLVPESTYTKEDPTTSAQLAKRQEHGEKIVLFYGRRVPHKGHKDILKTIAAYKVIYPNQKLHVALIGSPSFETYTKELELMIKDLVLHQDISLLGKVSYEVLTSYLNHADIFFSMSEHEGFFMPLVECMNHNIPILAYASSAIPYTLGDGGVMFDKKLYPNVACLLHEILFDEELRVSIIRSQEMQLKKLDHKMVEVELLKLFQ